jgi:hypothetical protein
MLDSIIFASQFYHMSREVAEVDWFNGRFYLSMVHDELGDKVISSTFT